jgi:large subunit ribosomal protein L18
MATNARYHVKFRRRREGKTDYRKRLALLKSGQTRLVVRQSLKYVTVQLVDYIPQGDMVVFTHSSRKLKDLGWTFGTGNVPAAYLIGYLAGKESLKRDVSEAILDIGRLKPTPNSRVFAVLKGLLDAGVKIPHSKKVLPSKDRLYGKHIDDAVEKNVKNVIEAIDKRE